LALILAGGFVLLSPAGAQDGGKKGGATEPAPPAAKLRPAVASLVTARIGSVEGYLSGDFSPDGRFLYTTPVGAGTGNAKGQIWSVPDLKKVIDILPHRKSSDTCPISSPLYHPRMSVAITTTKSNFTRGDIGTN
jgi:hypothetical protein